MHANFPESVLFYEMVCSISWKYKAYKLLKQVYSVYTVYMFSVMFIHLIINCLRNGWSSSVYKQRKWFDSHYLAHFSLPTVSCSLLLSLHKCAFVNFNMRTSQLLLNPIFMTFVFLFFVDTFSVFICILHKLFIRLHRLNRRQH